MPGGPVITSYSIHYTKLYDWFGFNGGSELKTSNIEEANAVAQVFVLGDVVQPGGYTLTATATVLNALYYAGGPVITSYSIHYTKLYDVSDVRVSL